MRVEISENSTQPVAHLNRLYQRTVPVILIEPTNGFSTN